MTARLIITVRGIVQGVGFRPFVLRSARELGVSGTVANTPQGVVIAAEGRREDCLLLVERIRHAPPPGALIFSADWTEEAPQGVAGFTILPSFGGTAQTAVSPDLGICKDCERELLDPADRRYRYPFLNCTACGPRFTILRRIPYDRANTTMEKFPMCGLCDGEYHDPENRRFHAQPTACPTCGPRLFWLEGGRELPGDPIRRFTDAIRAGNIIGVRGLGGYHLACDGENEDAVLRLRQKKHRYAKPLAVMVRSLAEAERLCSLSPEEREELRSPRRPILLLEKRTGCTVAEAVAPENRRLGVMLPYTPLHVLLMQDVGPIVLTSANLSDAPMPYLDEDACRVAALADGVLTHDRPILRRMDDSVAAFMGGKRRLIRRARGFVPEPVALPGAQTPLLAFGAQLKNTFCFAKEGRAYLSGHMGDLDDEETLAYYERELEAFLTLFGGDPRVFVCDLHPDYASTRIAQAWAARREGGQFLRVQHHQAHFASVLAEHGLPYAQGFLWDGSGYGEDGTIWGGEQLLGSAASVNRTASLRPIRLIGGDAAVREPWRAGLFAVFESCGADRALELFGHRPGAALLLSACGSNSLSPESSGMGRLFDAVAAIAGLHPVADYEGQAAIALEQAYEESAQGRYAFDCTVDPDGLTRWDWRPVIREAVRDIPLGPGVISAKFHRALIALLEEAVLPGEPVALSGGVFQNGRLLAGCLAALERRGIPGYANQRVPANDGGISYGQAAVAAARLEREN